MFPSSSNVLELIYCMVYLEILMLLVHFKWNGRSDFQAFRQRGEKDSLNVECTSQFRQVGSVCQNKGLSSATVEKRWVSWEIDTIMALIPDRKSHEAHPHTPSRLQEARTEGHAINSSYHAFYRTGKAKVLKLEGIFWPWMRLLAVLFTCQLITQRS